MTINVDKLICLKCRKLYYDKNTNVKKPSSKKQSSKSNSNAIVLPFKSVAKSRAHCVFCHHVGKGLTKILSDARLQVFISNGVIVPLGLLCCKSHLSGMKLQPSVIAQNAMCTSDKAIATTNEVTELLNGLKNIAMQKNKIDFDTDMTSDDIYNATGLNKNQFEDVCSFAISMKKSKNRTIHQGVGILLTKLRTGLSDRVLGTLFGIETRRKVAHIISSAKSALVKDFVPLNLGFGHKSRESIREDHLAVQLFSNFLSDAIILVMDGTYIYIQKSSKHQLQRKCYSMHKCRPLIKPMMITTTTGYIVSVLGPYFSNGKNNDACITEHIFKTNADNISYWMKQEDILILDRGFYDVLPFLNDIGIQTHSPAFLNKNEKQLSTEKANNSRLVTKLRWVVEGVNGRIKSWQYIDKVVKNRDLPNIWDYISIIAALCNKYKPPLRQSLASDSMTAHEMLKLSRAENAVKKRVMMSKNLQRHNKHWEGLPLMSPNVVPGFPSLSESDLHDITFGVYQVNQARNYIDEHVLNGKSDIFIHTEESDLIHARIQSRHTSSKQYSLWIQYTKSDVMGWYCECKAGSRTVGCCSHVATIIWYLGYARHIDYQPHSENYTKLLFDASNLSDTSDDSD